MFQRRTMAPGGIKDGPENAGMVQRRTVAKNGTKDGLGRARMVQRRTVAKDDTKDGPAKGHGPGWYKGWSRKYQDGPK
jgi:hypothetical protein